MAIETLEQIQQYLICQKKSEIELRAICEGLEISTEGSKEELLERLTTKEITPQNDIILPQAIPLKSRNEKGELNHLANETYKQWRKLIFQGKRNWKTFKLLNSEGKQYTAKMKYMLISERALQKILDEEWYDRRFIQQKELIQYLRTNPDDFNIAIIQKYNSSGNSWLMLHSEAKKTAA